MNWQQLSVARLKPTHITNGCSDFSVTCEVDYAKIAQAVVALMAIPEPWTLSIDRTEWQFGDCVFNILMLGIVHEGVAFPVVWCLLDKRGNSNSTERMKLFDQFLEYFRERDIACLTADREFALQDWFGYLFNEPLTPFRIRIRENHQLRHGRQSLKVRVLFQDLQVGQHKILRHKRQLWGHWDNNCSVAIRGWFLTGRCHFFPHLNLPSPITPSGGELKHFLGFLKLVGFVWNLPI